MTAYDTNSRFYWFIWIFIVLYTIGTGIYIGVFIQNFNITYTYFANPGAPGSELVSLRGSFTDVVVRMSVFGHVLSIMFLMCLIAYRKSFGAQVVWFGLYFLCFLLVLLNLGAGLSAYTHCNNQNQFGNICNDFKYCCPEEIYSNPANRCPNTMPCDPPLQRSDLKPNRDFLGLFWLNFILFFGQVVLMIVLGFVGQKETYEQEEEEYDEILPSAPEKIVAPIIPVGPKKRVHGLRSRSQKQ